MRNIVTRTCGTLRERTSLRWILLTTALGFALTSALSMTTAPHAQAQSDCVNRICLYEHDGYRGRHVAYSVGPRDMTRFGPFFNDMASSIRNDTGARWCAYEHVNYGGAHLLIAAQEDKPSLGSWNDRISSIRRC
jgi:hypothetical protein